MNVYYKIADRKIRVKTIYSNGINNVLRRIGGIFNYSGKYWEVSSTRLDVIEEHAGKLESKIVVAQIPLGEVIGAQTLRIGFYVLAHRDERDSPVQLYADLVQGTLPDSGGSVKNVCVAASDDAVFEFECYEDFAIAQGLKIVEEQSYDKNVLLEQQASLEYKLNIVKNKLKEIGHV